MGNPDGRDTERFVARQNIGRYEKLLAFETDPTTRRLLVTRLAEERACLLNLMPHRPRPEAAI